MKEYGIIGYPLSHSFSEIYFTKKFQQAGLTDCNYTAHPLQSIAELKNLLETNPGLRGLNVTIPYKQSILPYLTDSTNIPAGLVACNCIRIAGAGIIGYNTDIIGFEQSILPFLKIHHPGALVLGNGGAAAAVKYVLQKLQIPFQVVGRKLSDGISLLYDALDEYTIRENKLIINTTPLGTFPRISEFPPIPYQYVTPEHFLFDLVYNPVKTMFLKKGEAQGATIQNGYYMLVTQAEESWKIWNT